MTADEILSKESYDFLKGAKRIRVKIAMKEYARQKCKEQRVNCLHNLLSGYAEGEGYFSSVGTESWRTLNQKQIAKIICDERTEPEMD